MPSLGYLPLCEENRRQKIKPENSGDWSSGSLTSCILQGSNVGKITLCYSRVLSQSTNGTVENCFWAPSLVRTCAATFIVQGNTRVPSSCQHLSIYMLPWIFNGGGPRQHFDDLRSTWAVVDAIRFEGIHLGFKSTKLGIALLGLR